MQLEHARWSYSTCKPIHWSGLDVSTSAGVCALVWASRRGKGGTCVSAGHAYGKEGPCRLGPRLGLLCLLAGEAGCWAREKAYWELLLGRWPRPIGQKEKGPMGLGLDFGPQAQQK